MPILSSGKSCSWKSAHEITFLISKTGFYPSCFKHNQLCHQRKFSLHYWSSKRHHRYICKSLELLNVLRILNLFFFLNFSFILRDYQKWFLNLFGYCHFVIQIAILLFFKIVFKKLTYLYPEVFFYFLLIIRIFFIWYFFLFSCFDFEICLLFNLWRRWFNIFFLDKWLI